MPIDYGLHAAFKRVIEMAREHQTEDDKQAINEVEDYYVNWVQYDVGPDPYNDFLDR